MNAPSAPALVAVPRQASPAYGLLGLPLAFVALPLYVLLPNHYARNFGVPLAALGALLLGARLFDALIDPMLGRWSDRLFARSARTVLGAAAAASIVLGLGFALLFFPPLQGVDALLAWAGACLVLTYAAFSALTVMHQSWGAMLGGDESQRSRVVAWREGLGLAGVILASVSPIALGLPATVGIFFVAIGLGWLAWTRAPRPKPAAAPELSAGRDRRSLWLPWSRPGFRRLLAVFIVNGIASAIPATLLLFFVQDVLQAPPAAEPLCLSAYFVAAALSIAAWLKLVGRFGLARGEGLFIDDRIENVRAGEAEGFPGHHFTGLARLRTRLAAEGLITAA